MTHGLNPQHDDVDVPTAVVRDQVARLDHLAYLARQLQQLGGVDNREPVEIDYVKYDFDDLAAIGRFAWCAIQEREALWHELLD